MSFNSPPEPKFKLFQEVIVSFTERVRKQKVTITENLKVYGIKAVGFPLEDFKTQYFYFYLVAKECDSSEDGEWVTEEQVRNKYEIK